MKAQVYAIRMANKSTNAVRAGTLHGLPLALAIAVVAAVVVVDAAAVAAVVVVVKHPTPLSDRKVKRGKRSVTMLRLLDAHC